MDKNLRQAGVWGEGSCLIKLNFVQSEIEAL